MDKNFIPISVAFVFAILISFWIKGVLNNNNVKVNPFTGYNLFGQTETTNFRGRAVSKKSFYTTSHCLIAMLSSNLEK
ncbi:MAG TPA: hypothetical protein VN726_19535 [Hanamia sp.]|nr:hypothetical protein [Hanamia sp.]